MDTQSILSDIQNGADVNVVGNTLQVVTTKTMTREELQAQINATSSFIQDKQEYLDLLNAQMALFED